MRSETLLELALRLGLMARAAFIDSRTDLTGRKVLGRAIPKHLHRKKSDSIFADGVGSQAF
jgi:hypothetical protein